MFGEQSEGPPELGGPVAVGLWLEGSFEKDRLPSRLGRRAQIALKLISPSFNSSRSHSLKESLRTLYLPRHCTRGQEHRDNKSLTFPRCSPS